MGEHYENVGDLRSLETGKLAKPSEEAFNRETELQPGGSQGKNLPNRLASSTCASRCSWWV